MNKPNLILRPTVMAGDRLKNDFSVFFHERRVGRIRLAAGRLGLDASWAWVINPPLPIPSGCEGSEPDLWRAMGAFRQAWEPFYAGLTPDDIAHWHADDRID
jgi:hypothetical protein